MLLGRCDRSCGANGWHYLDGVTGLECTPDENGGEADRVTGEKGDISEMKGIRGERRQT